MQKFTLVGSGSRISRSCIYALRSHLRLTHARRVMLLLLLLQEMNFLALI
jgi:hypothetical protein